MLQLNSTTLAAVVDQALKDAAQHPRWVAAINRAVRELEANPFIERQDGHAGLIIGSPSGQAYSANGICSCCAFTGIDPQTGVRLHKGGLPCWHRACARLVRLCDERQSKAEIDADQAKRRAEYELACAQMDELYV